MNRRMGKYRMFVDVMDIINENSVIGDDQKYGCHRYHIYEEYW